MVASIRVTKVDTKKLQELKKSLPDRFDALLRAAATEIVTDIKLSFNTSAPGASYKRGRVTHVASQPGSPPNIDTGALRASITFIHDRRGRYVITDGVAYGAMLEIGTERMAARPFFTPVLEQWRARKFAQLASSFNVLG